MDDDWETAADNEVVLVPKPTADVNKWAGEDDDDDVKESWEDEEEKKDEEKPAETKITPSKKVTKAEKNKIAEAERLAEEELEKQLASMTPEEKLAEKLRLQKIQEEADLKSALETLGVSNMTSIDSFQPDSKEEFKEFSSALSWKITHFKESPHYTQFIEELLRNVCAPMAASEMKKIKMCVENLHSEKIKLEKQSKKNIGKAKARATIRTESDDIDSYQHYGADYQDYDDFM